jgi:uroporphyrinogen III methyltransferase/synthase
VQNGFWAWRDGQLEADPLDNGRQPLAGKRIVITRTPEQSGELTGSLERLGAEVLLLPMVGFAAPENWSSVDAAIGRLAEFDWILFTSQNAVRFFALRLRELKIAANLAAPRKPQIAVVGPATQEAAAQEGFHVEYSAQNHTGEGLARELAASVSSRNVLLPRSDRADDRLPDALREAGARVTAVTTYRTAVPDKVDAAILGQLQRAEVDAIVFASPSALHNLHDFIPAADLAKLSERVQFAAIGPTTARALHESGVRVEIEANESSSAALADAIAKHYQRHAAGAGRS